MYIYKYFFIYIYIYMNCIRECSFCLVISKKQPALYWLAHCQMGRALIGCYRYWQLITYCSYYSNKIFQYYYHCCTPLSNIHLKQITGVVFSIIIISIFHIYIYMCSPCSCRLGTITTRRASPCLRHLPSCVSATLDRSILF